MRLLIGLLLCGLASSQTRLDPAQVAVPVYPELRIKMVLPNGVASDVLVDTTTANARLYLDPTTTPPTLRVIVPPFTPPTPRKIWARQDWLGCLIPPCTLTLVKPVAGLLLVFRNGLLNRAGVDYNVVGSEIKYIYPAGQGADCNTAIYETTEEALGTVELLGCSIVMPCYASLGPALPGVIPPVYPAVGSVNLTDHLLMPMVVAR